MSKFKLGDKVISNGTNESERMRSLKDKVGEVVGGISFLVTVKYEDYICFMYNEDDFDLYVGK